MVEIDRNLIWQARPANPRQDRWRDASPIGNGETGALIFGDVGKERIRFTRADLWRGDRDAVPPDIHETLSRTRALMDEGKYAEANVEAYRALGEKGYAPGLACPFPLCDLTAEFSYDSDVFGAYRRALHLDSALSEITYRMSENPVVRKSFVSYTDGIFYMSITAAAPVSCTLALDLPDTASYRNDPHSVTVKDRTLIFEREYRQTGCGAQLRILNTDGELSSDPASLTVTGFTSVEIALHTCSDLAKADFQPAASFDEAFDAHRAAFGELYSRTDLRLSAPSAGSCNETLLMNAFSDGASPELLEKLWRFGRYLFLSGTRKDFLPFPLYGLWAGDYDLVWAQHVSNENVEILYWHLFSGALPELMLPLIEYFCRKIPDFRDNARNLFGCRGIVVSAYTTPFNGHLAPTVPVILNYTMASGWICRSFFDYYEMTGDEKTLREKILPFALETAAFIEDFAVIRGGKLMWYPSVSPENSPLEFLNTNPSMGHPMPTTRNSTMEIAIVKETLTRLGGICEKLGLCAEKLPVWKRLAEAIPPYACNKDGAVREWQTPEFTDYYCHRHLSHIYPVFPGCEVTRESDPELFRAFEKAVELRELGGQSGWSLAHMAGIYARFGRGGELYRCLDLMCRGCLTDNFFTLHNDWREDHLTVRWNNPPIQLDALMGAVNALQQMLLDWDGHTLRLFGALPDLLKQGSASGLAFPGGTADLVWDREKGSYQAELHAERELSIKVDVPESSSGSRRTTEIRLSKGQSAVIRM